MLIFPVVFMLHEFEELMMLKPWLAKNRTMLCRRLKGSLFYNVVQLHTEISASACSLIIAEEFLLISIISLLATFSGQYNLWLGLVGAFQIHLIIHILQAIVLHIYIPALITSVLCSVYTFIILAVYRYCFCFETAAIYGFVFLCMLAVNLAGCFKMALAFDKWLNKYSSDNGRKQDCFKS